MMNTRNSETTCGCCEGTQPITPQPLDNRPGLPSLAYRAGIHATFLESMVAHLSQTVIEIPTNQLDGQGETIVERYFPLEGLRTRATDDPAIALLDAWATVADVLTFYQERIANEGYLRTSTERRSILELGRLVGYALRPGVAASVFLAYTLEKGGRVVVPEGSRVQSVPAPGEMPQFFETSEPLEARAEWNTLHPRRRQPQYVTKAWLTPDKYIYILPPNPPLKVNDAVIISFGAGAGQQVLYRVLEATPLEIEAPEPGNPPLALVRLRLQPWRGDTVTQPGLPDSLIALLRALFRNIAGRYLNVATFGISPGSPTTQDVAMRMQAFVDKVEVLLDSNISAKQDEFMSMLAGLLAELQAIFEVLDHRFVRLRQWLGGLLDELGMVERILRAFIQVQSLTATSDLEEGITLLLKLISEFQNILYDLAAFPALAEILRSQVTQRLSALITLRNRVAKIDPRSSKGGVELEPPAFTSQLASLRKSPAMHPGSPLRLSRHTGGLYRYDGDLAPHLLTALDQRLTQAYSAWGSATVPVHPLKEGARMQAAAAMRLQAAFFGHNLPGKPVFARDSNTEALYIDSYTTVCLKDVWSKSLERHADLGGFPEIYLDREYAQVEQGSWLVIERAGVALTDDNGNELSRLSAHRVKIAQKTTLSYLGNSAEVTRLELDPPWMEKLKESEFIKLVADSQALKGTRVFAQAEALQLPLAPIDEEVSGSLIELDALYDGLQPGRWLIVSGERTDIPGASGVTASEQVMLANVIQGTQMLDENTGLPGDSPHTFIELASGGLAYHYKRSTVKVYANVVKATHGETRSEVLGSGNGSHPYQAFELRQPPLTYVAAPNAEGVEATLKVRVNDVLWHLASNLVALAPDERRYVLKTDDEGKTRVIFGDGGRGARLPTGVENVRAEYRTGIGKGGNVKAGQISLLVSRPLGAKDVINPLPASGGADRESRDQARKRVPLALMALDRLLSVQDYEDFARTFAGIGKANAARLSDGLRTLVHLTIAGEDDTPIDVNSDLYRNFVKALRRLGDPFQPIQVAMREKVPLVIEAGVKTHPDYLWEKVEAQVRAVLLETFGFEKRDLGQDVTSSEVLGVMQAVRGVEYIDLDTLDSLPEARLTSFLELQGELTKSGGTPGVMLQTNIGVNVSLSRSLNLRLLRRVRAEMARSDPEDPRLLLPAQILYLDPQVQDTLILKELPR